MKKLLLISILAITCMFTAISNGKQLNVYETHQTEVTLQDKPLSEIKKLINGRWELVTGQNSRELNEFEKTFIEFKGDDYVWIEDGVAEKGKLNWRKAPAGNGNEVYIMDAFYAEFPSYPISVKGDTLFIQDCTATAYKYTLVRK